MEIIKSLNLNRNPKDVTSGSLVCAKNMVVDHTSSYLTNEPGFGIGFACPNAGEFIVGCIPCISEIVIFTWNRDTKESKIYRKGDDKEAVEVPTNWKYSGGKLTGSFTYNYKKELIIGLGEYDAYDVSGNLVQVPFKCWNLDSKNVSNSYNIEDIIPKFKVDRYVKSSGRLVCGVYTIFIRFKVDEASYTKWFQITDDIIIIDSVSKEAPNHEFLNADNTRSEKANVEDFKNVFYNTDTVSNKEISLVLTYLEATNYEKYQIGYIIRHGSDVKGRLFSEFSINDVTVNISNNDYVEEIEIDEFTKNPHQFYNVKNIITYNNRLYLSNYTEYKNEDLQVYADKCKVGLKAVKESLDEIKSYDVINIHINTAIYKNSNIDFFINNINTYTVNKNGEELVYITNPKNFMKELASKINIYATLDGRVDNVATGFYQFYGFNKIVIPRTSPSSPDVYLIYEKVTYRLAFLDDNTDVDKLITLYTSNISLDNLVDYKLRISNGILYIELDDYVQEFNSSNVNEENKLGLCIEVIIEHELFDAINGYRTEYGYTWIGNVGYDVIKPYPIRRPDVKFRVFSETNTVSNSIKYESNINKTLIPGQVYSFYIHYIRPDRSYTNGYPLTNDRDYLDIDYSADKGPKDNNVVNSKQGFIGYKTEDGRKLFLCPPSTSDETPCIRFKVYDAVIPVGYIGYFISYEKLENIVNPVLPIEKIIETDINNNITKKLNITNTDYIYSNGQITGRFWFNAFGYLNYNSLTTTEDSNNNNLIGYLTKYKELLNYPHVITETKGIDSIIEDNGIILINDNKNVYNKTTKTLYRLTDDIFRKSDIKDDNYYLDNYVPGFYSEEKVITYNSEIIINPTASHVLDKNGAAISGYSIKTHSIKNYFNNLLDAYSLLQDYNAGSVSLVDSNGKALGVAYNKILSPDRLHDFLEIKAAYTSAPLKSYTNYSKNYIDTFDKTIYRSNVISDESLVNGFREFEIDNYKNIFENKGNIINIIGIGLYFIVHTEYSIFVFDRTPKLTQKTQLDIPDVFDISYQELLPSTEGFGGITCKEESIISKNGYIWFDKKNRVIFKYENGQIKAISQDIYNFIKHLNIYTMRFAEDLERNRLLICIYLNEYDNDGNRVTITLSYNFNTEKYISIHDYSFTHNYKTSSVSYLFDENRDRSRLYVYDDKVIGFRNLRIDYDKYYDMYITDKLMGNEEFNICSRLGLNMIDTYLPVNSIWSIYSSSKGNYYIDKEETEKRSRRAAANMDNPTLVVENDGTFSFVNINFSYNVRYTLDGTEPNINNAIVFKSSKHEFKLNGSKGMIVSYGRVEEGHTPVEVIDKKIKTILNEDDFDGTPPSITPFKYTEGTGQLFIGVNITQSDYFGTTYYTLDGSTPDENSEKLNYFYLDGEVNDYGVGWHYSKSKQIYYKENIIIKAITIYGNKKSEITTFNTIEENPYPTLIAPEIKETDTTVIIENKNRANVILGAGDYDNYGRIKYIINDDDSTEREYTNPISLERKYYNLTVEKTPIYSVTAWIEYAGNKSKSTKLDSEKRDIYLDLVSIRIKNETATKITVEIYSKIWNSYNDKPKEGQTPTYKYPLYYTLDGSEPDVNSETTHLYEGEFNIESETQIPITTIKTKIIRSFDGKLFTSNTTTYYYTPEQDESEEIVNVNEEYVYVPETKGEGKIDSNLVYKSYVDIIVNGNYETPKVLNNISYILSELQYYYLKHNAAEEDLIRTFSGDYIMIYSDIVNTGILNIETSDKINKLNDYKHPYYEKGKWNLNYFRNKITTPISANENNNNVISIVNNKDERIILEKDIEDVSKVDGKVFSDERSLVYGKYFVIRFIFNNDKKIKLESLDVNIQNY